MIHAGHTKCSPHRAAGAVVTIDKVRHLHAPSVVHASSASATSSGSKWSHAAPLHPSCRSHPAEAHNVAQSQAQPQLWDGRARQRAWPSAIHGSLVYCTRVSDLHWWDICGPQASLRSAFAIYFAKAKVLTDCACNVSDAAAVRPPRHHPISRMLGVQTPLLPVSLRDARRRGGSEPSPD